MDKIRFSVELTPEANDALTKDAERHIRSRKAQAEFILEQHYKTAGAKERAEEREQVAA